MNFIATSILFWITQFIIFFPTLSSIGKIGLRPKGSKSPLPLKIMMIHLIIACFLQLCITIFELFHINFVFLFHLYVLEEFIMDMLFYRELLKKTHPYKDKPIKRKIFLVAIILFTVFAIINALFITDLNTFPVYTFAIQSVVMIICTLRYNYVRSFREPIPVSTIEVTAFKLYKGPVFWMNTGKLIYFIFALPLFILYHTATEAKLQNMAMLIWAMQNISLIALHIFMGIGFLKFKTNPKDVLDIHGEMNKLDEEQIKKRMQQDPEFAKRVAENSYFEQFRKNNPELF